MFYEAVTTFPMAWWREKGKLKERVELRTKANLFQHVVPVGDDSISLQSGMVYVLFV